MIDVENLVFDTVYNALIQQYPNANITAGYDELNAIFPTIIITETNNQPYLNSVTDNCVENHARLTYEVEVESNKASTGRSECRAIMKAVDNIMHSMKFRRIHMNRPLNIDRTIWRQSARYEVIVEKGVTVERVENGETVTDTIYQMYRR